MLARKGDYGVLAQDEFDARDGNEGRIRGFTNAPQGLLSPPRVARSGQQNVYYFSPTGDIAGDDGSTEVRWQRRSARLLIAVFVAIRGSAQLLLVEAFLPVVVSLLCRPAMLC
jgi:hypothetical protein